ncbi:MAG: glucans biosynthesis glucosyltransferase MdoH [Amylibacter sp.]|nr:glucans biosynthesis glucosyltransferase MdoH [Amylibacter sp.]
MNDMSPQPFNPQNWMPAHKPIGMPTQDFRNPYRDRDAPNWQKRSYNWASRLFTFGAALLTTGLLLAAFTDWLSTGGFGALEYFLILMVGLTFFWISLSVSTATVGIASFWLQQRKPQQVMPPSTALDVALLVPIYNENPSDVFGNAAAMLEDLRAAKSKHRFSLFILSDTQDPEIADQEMRAMMIMRNAQEDVQIYYRRRRQNTDRKTGNITDWIEGWGGGYKAMLVLDADSLMSSKAIITLADELSNDPSAGLIQSCPKLFGAQTLFARMQQFSNVTYGWPMAEGLALWSNREGNYWGHNAIIRTAAFASCAGLPRVKDRLILSHDFVEASLLRRAGWAVRFMPRIEGSYEETPATLIDYVLRDRRWCQGNLQHLRIMSAAGLHAVSRFHLLHGAISYLLSPAWFILLMIWALISNGQGSNVISYFSDASPKMPIWPHISTVSSMLILLFMYGMLLAPKVIGAAVMWASPDMRRDYGGSGQFAASFALEVLTSFAYAPVLMIQQTIAVLRSLVGIHENWEPQMRRGGKYTISTLIKFHIVEQVFGFALVFGMMAGIVSLWLLPIAISLSGAVFLSAISGVNLVGKSWGRRQLGTPDEVRVPRVIALSSRYRAEMREALDVRIAAE